MKKVLTMVGSVLLGVLLLWGYHSYQQSEQDKQERQQSEQAKNMKIWVPIQENGKLILMNF